MPPSTVEFLKGLVELALMGVQLLIVAGLLVLAGFSFRAFRRTWLPGLLFGILAALMAMPSSIIALIYLDVGRLLENHAGAGRGPVIPKDTYPAMKVIGAIFWLAIVALSVPLRGVYYHVASVEWARVRGNALEGLGGPRRWRWVGVLAGVGVGLVCLAGTYVLFNFLQVRDSEEVKNLERLFPDLESSPAWVQMTAALSMASAAAIVEEIVFRGAVLGFLLRITGNRTLPAWGFIAAVALIWALLHIPNTSQPGAKVLQIFVMGLACGGLMRRWGLGSTIAAHLTLNVVAVLTSPFFSNQ